MAFLPYVQSPAAAPTPSYAFVRVQQIQHAGGRRCVKLDELAARTESKRLIAKLEATANRTAAAAPMQQAVPQKQESTQFAPGCRMVTTCGINETVPFERKLELLQNGRWQTICGYVTIDRIAYKFDFIGGHHPRVKLDLPPYVVAEMSAEDLKRNWMRYCSEFCSAPAKAEV